MGEKTAAGGLQDGEAVVEGGMGVGAERKQRSTGGGGCESLIYPPFVFLSLLGRVLSTSIPDLVHKLACESK